MEIFYYAVDKVDDYNIHEFQIIITASPTPPHSTFLFLVISHHETKKE